MLFGLDPAMHLSYIPGMNTMAPDCLIAFAVIVVVLALWIWRTV